MKLIIDIPKEFEEDFYDDKFEDFFSRVIANIDHEGMCGKYEKEIAEMFIEVFSKAITGNKIGLDVKPTSHFTTTSNEVEEKVDKAMRILEENYGVRTKVSTNPVDFGEPRRM